LAVGLALLFGIAALAPGPFDGQGFAIAGSVCGLVAALVGGVAWWGRQSAVRALLFTLWTILAVELLLQGLTAVQLVPWLAMQENAPWGRVYWSMEGSRSGLMSRWGWHQRRVAFDDDAQRIVLVGDSFVEALQVNPRSNSAAQLEGLLATTGDDIRCQVMALGRSATGPAHHRVHVQYALEHHAPDQLILLLFLGNDLADNLWTGDSGGFPGHGQMMLYDVDGDGTATLHGDSEIDPERYRQRLEANHELGPASLARSIMSQSLLLGALQTLPRVLAVGPPTGPEQTGAGPPDAPPNPMAPQNIDQRALSLVRAMLSDIQQDCQAAGVRLRVYTLPPITPAFWARARGEDTASAPAGFAEEQALATWAAPRQLELTPLGPRLLTMPEDRIEALFFGGAGHFTAEGHGWLAAEIAPGTCAPPR